MTEHPEPHPERTDNSGEPGQPVESQDPTYIPPSVVDADGQPTEDRS